MGRARRESDTRTTVCESAEHHELKNEGQRDVAREQLSRSPNFLVADCMHRSYWVGVAAFGSGLRPAEGSDLRDRGTVSNITLAYSSGLAAIPVSRIVKPRPMQ